LHQKLSIKFKDKIEAFLLKLFCSGYKVFPNFRNRNRVTDYRMWHDRHLNKLKKKLSIESFHTANTKCRLLDEMHFPTLCALSIVLLTLHACHSIESLTFFLIERLLPPCSPCISPYLIWKIPLGFRGENTTCS
jgi:hypothetical protein